MIGFPQFNIFFNINPIAFSIGNVSIYWYGIFISFAIVLSIILCKINKNTYGINFNDTFIVSCVAILLGIIGARIYYVIFNLEYYLSFPEEILKVNNGGIAIYGGIIFGVISIYILSKVMKFNFLDMLDNIVPYVALSQMIGRIGNFVNVEAYGTVTDSLFRMQIENGTCVHPTFLYEMVITLTIFIILSINRKYRKFRGEQTCIYLIVYGLGRFFVEGLRTDSLMIGDFRISQVVSLMFFVFGIIALIVNYTREKKTNVK